MSEQWPDYPAHNTQQKPAIEASAHKKRKHDDSPPHIDSPSTKVPRSGQIVEMPSTTPWQQHYPADIAAACSSGTQNKMEGNSQRNVGNNQTESRNGEGSGRQVTSHVTGNKIGTYIQTITNNAASTSSPSDIVIDYCPTPVSTFICREEELKELKKVFQHHQVIVLMGMGGLGKTQLSRQFASVNKSAYRYRYWLESETTKQLEDSFNYLATKLHVAVSNKNVRVNDVYKALENIPTLLIFDNVEKPADVYNYLPTRVEMTRAKVHVLITSRWTVWTRDKLKCYPLKPLDKQAAQQLFKKNFDEAYKKVDESLWQKLANNLGHLPLALQVATSYITERHEVNSDLRSIVTKYIDQLAKGAKRLLTDPLVEYDNKSIYNSMILTFELVEEQQDDDETKQALRLMNFACYMNPDRIYKKDLLELIDGDDKEHMMEGAMVILTKFSLMNKVNTENGQEHYTMHRIIQRSIRHNQTEKGTADDYYMMVLDTAVHQRIYDHEYVMNYADERASCVYRYYYAHPSSPLLRRLVYNGFCVALRKILEADTKSMINKNEWLLDSAQYSNIDMVQLLHEYGADIKQKDNDGNTALHNSCKKGSTDIVRWLLDNGADPRATNGYGETPAHCAVVYIQAETLTLLLERDKSVADLKDHRGYTPFYYIMDFFKCEKGATDLANIFIKYGVDVTQPTATGETIIHMAAKYAVFQFASHILRLHPSLINIADNEGRTPLHVVGDSRYLNEDNIISTIRVLMQYGLSLATKDNQGRTILHTVSRNCYHREISFILQQNPSLIKSVDNEGRSALHAVCDTMHAHYTDDTISTIRVLIENGLPLDTKDNQGRTILHTLSRHCYHLVISLILRMKPSLINSVDNEGRTALHVVGDTSCELCVDMLISTIEVLMKYGLSLDTKDNQGRTLLDTINPKWQHIWQKIACTNRNQNPD